jgi:hypothetical protein
MWNFENILKFLKQDSLNFSSLSSVSLHLFWAVCTTCTTLYTLYHFVAVRSSLWHFVARCTTLYHFVARCTTLYHCFSYSELWNYKTLKLWNSETLPFFQQLLFQHSETTLNEIQTLILQSVQNGKLPQSVPKCYTTTKCSKVLKVLQTADIAVSEFHSVS